MKCIYINKCPSATGWCNTDQDPKSCIPFIINASNRYKEKSEKLEARVVSQRKELAIINEKYERLRGKSRVKITGYQPTMGSNKKTMPPNTGSAVQKSRGGINE